MPNPLALPGRLANELSNVAVLAKAGIIAPMHPAKLPRLGLAALTWGPTLGAGVAAGAVRHPDAVMACDPGGSRTWREADARTSAIAVGLRELGVRPGDAVGLLARNHTGFVEALAAAAKAGADVLLLNTGFSGPALAEVCAREEPSALLHDAEFAPIVGEAGADRLCVLTDTPAAAGSGEESLNSLDSLAERYAGRRPPRPGRGGRLTILTSGTTGTPKGATRGSVGLTLDAPAGLLATIPWRAGMTVVAAAPLFHAWGLANLALGMGLGTTTVLRPRFDPEQTLADIAAHRAEGLVAVPVMLQRILALPAEVRERYDVGSLRVVAVSGSAVSADLARSWMDAFGDNLYNLYGSTEVATASIASPADLRAAPGTVGRPPRGVRLRLLDDDGVPVPQGRVGRVYVGNSMLFEGYTGGGDKHRVDGLVATGDLGRIDETGRLFVEGRDDDMIVSGGENVFPLEVEDALLTHPAVVDAAAIGVPDDEFGQRLRAFVVLAPDGSAGDVDPDELRTHVRERLAGYKVPREVVVLDELPRNATGKVLKRELPER